MLQDQAYRLRQMARERQARRAAPIKTLPLVVVSGGKGGVGASTLAYHLATALTQTGNRALFVEADLDRGGSSWTSESERTLADCLQSGVPLLDVICETAEGTAIIPGPWAPNQLVTYTPTGQERLIAELQRLADRFDVAVIDLGSGRDSFVSRFWSIAAMTVVVTTPDATSITETYAAIKLLHAGVASIPVYTLVNFADEAGKSSAIHERLQETCHRFLGLRTTPLGEVPTIKDETPGGLAEMALPIAQAIASELGLAAGTTMQAA